MPNDFFRFKRFTVNQGQSAMKVGTDGVLLGAWCTSGKFSSILDVGSGTGLISLIMAQRNSEAFIEAVEIDEESFRQSRFNFENSPWKERLAVYHMQVQDFNPDRRHDHIISNPPFFINSLKSPDHGRTIARHTVELSQSGLINTVERLLAYNGIFTVIYPFEEAEIFIRKAYDKNFFCNRRTDVYPLPNKKPNRVMMEFSRYNISLDHNKLTIRNEKKSGYTEEYKKLTADFYLKF